MLTMRRALSLWLLLAATAFNLLPGAVASSRVPTKVVDVIQIKGLVDPPSTAYLGNHIAAASTSSTEVIVIELDSGGALVDQVASLARRIERSPVPVVVWVAPRGAEAAGGAALLAAAGDFTLMASDTHLGSVVPANLDSEPGPAEVKRTVALARELDSSHGRALPGEQASAGGSITSAQAVRKGAIDGIASSLAEVLKKIDGLTARAHNPPEDLETWDQRAARPSVGFRFEEMDPLARLLHAVTSPEVAFLLLLVGAFAVIFEIYNPGIGLAAIVGVAALAGSFYGLDALPTDWPAVLLILAAVACFVVDLQLSGFGIWSAAGVAGVIAGGALLFSGAPSAAQLSPWAIAAGVVISLLFFVSVMTAALRVRLRRPIGGEEGIVGTVGEARTDIAPEGTVFTNGKLWRGRTMETGIASGSKVRIKATEGLVLLVEPLHESEDANAAQGREGEPN